MPSSLFNKISPLKLAAIVFFVLALFIVIVEKPGTSESKILKGQRFFIPRMTVETVTKVEVVSPELSYTLKNEAGVWMIGETDFLPAKKEYAEDFLDSLHEVKEDSLVSKNIKKQPLYGVDTLTGVQISVWEGDTELADFYLGKVTGLEGQYARRTGSNEVVQLTTALSPFIAESLGDWHDKTILSVEPQNINRLTLKTLDDEWVLEFKSSLWSVIQPEEFQPSKEVLADLFSALSYVEAEAVVVDDAKIDEPVYKISTRSKDDSIQVAVFGEQNEEGFYPAQNGAQGVVYYVSQKTIDGLFGIDLKE